MRLVVLPLLALVAVPPPAMALELDGSQWVSPLSGLRVSMTRQGDAYELRVDSGSLLETLFGNVPPRGTLLLRMRMAGQEFSGTAVVFAPGCTFPYAVQGSLRGSTLQWSGLEPKDRETSTCRVTRTAFTTNSVRLVWAPAPPPIVQPFLTSASPRPLPPDRFTKPSSSSSDASSMYVIIVILFFLAGGICGVVLWLRYLQRLRLIPEPIPGAGANDARRSPALGRLLPDRSGAIFGNATDILAKDMKLVDASTSYLRARTQQTEAFGEYIDTRAAVAHRLAQHFATVPAIAHVDSNVTPTSFMLTIPELQSLLAQKNDLTDAQRGEIIRMIVALMKEKLAS